jgi:hypothetical protein
VTTKGTFLWSLDEIGLVVLTIYEEMSFKLKVYGRMDAGRRWTKSDHKRWAKNIIFTVAGLLFPLIAPQLQRNTVISQQ